MFAPDANIPLTQPPKLSKEEEQRMGMAAPKRINHSNTRIIQPSLSSTDPSGLIPPSPTRSNIAAAISGTPYPGRDPTTPKVNGYSFVDALPEPTAASLGPKALKKLMTIGTLASTPIALRSKDSDEPLPPPKEGPFKIPATPRREELAHKMARNASKSLSARHGVAVPTLQGAARKRLAGSITPATRDIFGSTPGSSRRASEGTPRRTAETLTPAGKALLGKTGSTTRSSISSAFAGKASAKEGRQREKEVQARLEKTAWD
jgi:protein DGCR14